MSQTKPITPTSTFWVHALVQSAVGQFQAKVSFGPGNNPRCGVVPPGVPGWNFSSRETAEEMAEHAARVLSEYPELAGWIVVTEVIEEN